MDSDDYLLVNAGGNLLAIQSRLGVIHVAVLQMGARVDWHCRGGNGQMAMQCRNKRTMELMKVGRFQKGHYQ